MSSETDAKIEQIVDQTNNNEDAQQDQSDEDQSFDETFMRMSELTQGALDESEVEMAEFNDVTKKSLLHPTYGKWCGERHTALGKAGCSCETRGKCR